jgi:hypothetical protein
MYKLINICQFYHPRDLQLNYTAMTEFNKINNMIYYIIQIFNSTIDK